MDPHEQRTSTEGKPPGRKRAVLFAASGQLSGRPQARSHGRRHAGFTIDPIARARPARVYVFGRMDIITAGRGSSGSVHAYDALRTRSCSIDPRRGNS